VRRHLALESHLAVWGFCAGAAIGLGAAHLGFGLSDVWVLPILLGTAPLVPLLVGGGRRVTAPYPVSLRWTLAPYQGLSILLVVLVESLGRWAARRRSTTASEELPESAPNGLREGVRDLASLTVEDVMVPRSQEVALQADLTTAEALRQAGERPYTHYPVYAESIDHTLGLVPMLDLTDPARAGEPIRPRVVSALIIPETMRALTLLQRLADAPLSTALVVDEFGGHSGLVTLGDVVEVVIGDLVGEHEEVRRRIIPLGDGVYRVEGGCEIEEFNEQVRPVLPEGEYDTVAGLILDRLGRIPQQGDDVVLSDVVLEVLERTDRRILWTQITLVRARAAKS
jgi:CBS domain containing-hemolysin-like protein